MGRRVYSASSPVRRSKAAARRIRRTSASPECRTRACWRWPKFSSPRKTLSPPSNTSMSAGCKRTAKKIPRRSSRCAKPTPWPTSSASSKILPSPTKAARSTPCATSKAWKSNCSSTTWNKPRNASSALKKKETGLETELALMTRCRKALEAEQPLRELEFKPEEMKMLTAFEFLTRKPVLYVLNLGDDEAADIDRVIEKHHLEKLSNKPETAVVP